MKPHSLLLVVVLLCLPVSGYAALFIEAPDSAPQGSAFVIQVGSDEPENFINVRWRKKHVRVPVWPQGDRWAGYTVLPMPLEEAASLTIQAKTNHATARVSIKPVPTAWKKQELQVEPKYVNPSKADMSRIERERRASRAVLNQTTPDRYWTLPCVRPVPGSLTSHFGEQRVFNGEPRSRHRGVDLRGDTGTPIAAMAAGKVMIAENHYFSGNVVYIDHGLGLVSLYAHLSSIAVGQGDMVEAGQLIGHVGATGRVTGPHLHWGVNILGFPVDPFTLLESPQVP